MAPTTQLAAEGDDVAAIWARARSRVDGLPGGGLNIAHQAVDRHVQHGRGGLVALRLLGKRGDRREVTYGELAASTSRFANALVQLGRAPGDVLAHARRRLGPAVAPRRILVAGDLPRTRSGKILRRLLRARELGLPEGDLSTLEPGAGADAGGTAP